ncbi:MAG: hypothetical protein O3B01_28870 [Planctomycetota bacterium]|nr:hypothetical protein [Planctomycetota bacterium]MDA1142596.1 hypothetical protein [Planctomycetota bacterium]
MNRLIASLSVLSLLFVFQSAKAEETKKEKKEKPAKAPLEEVTLSGKLVTKETTRTDKKTGAESKVVTYVLEGENGTKTTLPAPRKKKGEATAADPYAEHVNKNVTVSGMGSKMTKKDKKGVEQTSIRIATVTSIVAQ